MKPSLFAGLLLMISLAGCNKSSIDSGIFNEKQTVFVNQCNSFFKDGVAYKMCLDSVVDNRCPTGVECIWAGYVGASFSFKADSVTSKFTLFDTPSKMPAFPADTVIGRIKIQLMSVNPHPGIYVKYDYDAYRGEIILTPQ